MPKTRTRLTVKKAKKAPRASLGLDPHAPTNKEWDEMPQYMTFNGGLISKAIMPLMLSAVCSIGRRKQRIRLFRQRQASRHRWPNARVDN
jgi:hypothetical protein